MKRIADQNRREHMRKIEEKKAQIYEKNQLALINECLENFGQISFLSISGSTLERGAERGNRIKCIKRKTDSTK